MRSVALEPLSGFLGREDADTEFLPWGSPIGISRNLSLQEDLARFPEFGSDFEIFEDRFVEVMQFVVNHTTFDRDEPNDQALLTALAPLGIKQGKAFNPGDAVEIDGVALRTAAQRFASASLAKMGDVEYVASVITRIFLPKGEISPELLALLSVAGPIGQPAQEALYPPVKTADGHVMNAMNDYEIVMAADAMPPARAFWSVKLYDNDRGFFIPNERKKYSVGENAGFKLDKYGGLLRRAGSDDTFHS